MIVRSQSLSMLWDMVNGFQLMANMPLMSINIPANSLYFFGFVNQISNF